MITDRPYPKTTIRLPKFGLVQRLRLVFVLIVAVIGVAVFMALWQFKILGASQNNLLRTSVPVLVRTQLVERALHDLVISLADIEKAVDQNALSSIERNVTEQFELAQLSVTGLGRTLDYNAQTDAILRQLSAMESEIQTSLAIKEGLFQSEAVLDRLLSDLGTQRGAMRIVLEQLSFDASQRMDARASEVFVLDGDDREAQIKRLGKDPHQVNLIAELALELETIGNVVGQLGRTISSAKLNDTRDFLEFRMRGALKLMVRLPDTRERLELSVLIQKFRKTIFGSDGILNRTDLYAGKSRDLVQQNNAKQFVVRNIKADTELLMASAHGQLTQAGRLTQATTQRLIVILAIAAIVVFGIVVLAILVIVERQINARIGLLTGSVLRIAAGDTDHESQVSGSDELGRMADALNIFKQNARELLRSNAELEKFAYAAAHDLRSPLQAIHDLTVWTIEDSENKLSKDSAENLGLLQARVSRLSALLGDLLQYARIGADTAESFPFDLDDMVNESVAMLDPAGAFQVTHDWSGGEIETYHHPLQMILLNLIGNTLKHHGSSKGQIHISSTIVGDRLWVEYADDGPGIPPEYHLKVFGLFQTLKPRDEMEGSGLGLAITQKLVEHFEGAITIQPNGETASGTTFVFDFPARSVCAVAKAA